MQLTQLTMELHRRYQYLVTYMSRFRYISGFFLVLCYVAIGFWRSTVGLFHAFDTGLYLQLSFNMWTYGTGDSSLVGEPIFFAHHFQPTFLVTVPALVLFGFQTEGLVCIAALSVVVALVVGLKRCTSRAQHVYLVVLLALPCLNARIWYNFCPDVLAFPAWLLMALAALSQEPKRWWWWAVMMAWAGGCKEYFWLFNAGFCVFQSMATRERKEASGWAIAALVQLTIFSFLVLKWMPENSIYERYVPWEYYLKLWLRVDKVGWLALFFACLGLWDWKLWHPIQWVGFLPLLVTLLGEDPRFTHPLNHYLLPAAVWLWSGAFWRLREQTTTRWLSALPMLALLGYCLNETRVSQEMALAGAKRRAFAQELVQRVPSEASLVVDGSMQPWFPRRRNVKVLLKFLGNPGRLRLDRELYILTSLDLAEVDIQQGLSKQGWDIDMLRVVQRKVRQRGSLIAQRGSLYLFYCSPEADIGVSGVLSQYPTLPIKNSRVPTVPIAQ
jgi:hypothetical protein